MSVTVKLTVLLFISALSAVYLRKYFNNYFDVIVPNLEETWWGPQSLKVNNRIKPFRVNVSNNVLEDLKQRLNNARPFTPPLEGIQHQYGMNTGLLSEIVEYWKNKYNWKENEQLLNKYPQFITNIQGLDIHFIHVKPQNVPSEIKILPLLMLHGWPGSVREFYEIIPLLTQLNNENKTKFVFEVIVPSLPGYGFSKGSIRPGMGPTEIGMVMKNLMLRLGFEKFYIQGGDWGSIIASHMSVLFPNHVLGTHSNMCSVITPRGFFQYLLNIIYPYWLTGETSEIVSSPFELLEFFLLETGYLHIQATKPDTVGVGLNDSPVGLAAYILEKFTSGANIAYQKREDGGLKEKFTYDSLLDNIMIYWINKSMTTAMRLYAEGFNKERFKSGIERIPVTVPYACAKFMNDIHMPDDIISTKYKNLVQSNTYDGGHFAALEVPKLLAVDIWMAVDKMRLRNDD